MDKTQKAAYIISQSACAMIEALGMQADNMERARQGMSMAYEMHDFTEVFERYGITHNQVLQYLNGSIAETRKLIDTYDLLISQEDKKIADLEAENKRLSDLLFLKGEKYNES